MSTHNYASRAAFLLRHGDNYSATVRDGLVDDLNALSADEIERSAYDCVADARLLLSSLDLQHGTRTKATADAVWSLLDDATEKITQELQEQTEARTRLQQEVYDAQNVATQAQVDAQEARNEAEAQKHAATQRRDLTVAWNDYTDALTTGAVPANPRPQRGAFAAGCRYLVRMDPQGTLAVAVRGPNDDQGHATWFTDADKAHRQPVTGDLTVIAYLRNKTEIAAQQAEDDEYDEDYERPVLGVDWPTARATAVSDLQNTIDDHGNGLLDDEELDERLEGVQHTLQGAAYVPAAVAEEAARLVAQHTRRNYTDTELQAGMKELRALFLTDGKIDLTGEDA